MNRLFKYLLGIFSVVVFLTATTGVRVYSHYCSSAAVANTSIIESLATCDLHAGSSKTVPLNAEKSCCNTDSHCETPQPVKDNCCSNESYFFKISDDFTAQSESHWKVNPREISVANTFIPLINESVEKGHFSNGLILAFHPPPPKSGKQLIVFLQQQKTEPNPIA